MSDGEVATKRKSEGRIVSVGTVEGGKEDEEEGDVRKREGTSLARV